MFIESAYHIFFSQMKAASKNRKKASPEKKRLQREKERDNPGGFEKRELEKMGEKSSKPGLRLDYTLAEWASSQLQVTHIWLKTASTIRNFTSLHK